MCLSPSLAGTFWGSECGPGLVGHWGPCADPSPRASQATSAGTGVPTVRGERSPILGLLPDPLWTAPGLLPALLCPQPVSSAFLDSQRTKPYPSRAACQAAGAASGRLRCSPMPAGAAARGTAGRGSGAAGRATGTKSSGRTDARGSGGGAPASLSSEPTGQQGLGGSSQGTTPRVGAAASANGRVPEPGLAPSRDPSQPCTADDYTQGLLGPLMQETCFQPSGLSSNGQADSDPRVGRSPAVSAFLQWLVVHSMSRGWGCVLHMPQHFLVSLCVQRALGWRKGCCCGWHCFAHCLVYTRKALTLTTSAFLTLVVHIRGVQCDVSTHVFRVHW